MGLNYTAFRSDVSVIDKLYKILLKTSPRELAVLVVGGQGRNVFFILS